MEIEQKYKQVARSVTFNQLLKRYDLSQAKVLDLGCGNGEYLTHFGPGSLGISSSLGEVVAVKQKKLTVVCGNVEQLENLKQKIKEGNFDYFWANNLIEHLLSPHKFLADLRKFASSNCRLILGVPVIPLYPCLMSFKKFRGALASNHLNFFTQKTLELTISRAGWDIETCRSFRFYQPGDNFFKYFWPHLFFVCRKNKNFTYSAKKIEEWCDQPYYQSILDN